MWMAEPMEGEVVGELPTYAPAFKQVYRFILEATHGNVFAATDLFQKYLAGEMPERLLSGHFCDREGYRWQCPPPDLGRPHLPVGVRSHVRDRIAAAC